MNFTYRYLNLSRCSLSNFNVDILAELLSSCHSLEKLAIEWTHINSSMLNSISLQNGKTLEILALNYCFQTMGNEFRLEPIQQLVKNCNQLKELSLNCHDEIYSDGIDFLVNNLPPNLQKLSLETLDVTDNQVLTLVKRCPKLIALNLAETFITNKGVSSIIEHLKSALEEIDISLMDPRLDKNPKKPCRRIGLTKILELKAMPKLQVLLAGQFETNKLRSLFETPHIKIDECDLEVALPGRKKMWEIEVERLNIFPENSKIKP